MSEYRFRIGHSDPWKTGSLKDAEKLLKTKMSSVQIRLICAHTKTHIDDGVEYCRDCGDMIRVTSYRD